jgi:hypothetical protein
MSARAMAGGGAGATAAPRAGPHALPSVVFPIVDDLLTLRMDDGTGGPSDGSGGAAGGPGNGAEPGFPTSRLRTGLALWDGGSDLSEEGVGFGVPVLTMGMRAVFPGHVRLVVTDDEPRRRLTATFDLDLVERLTRRDGAVVGSSPLYAAKNGLAALHRRMPALRGPLTAVSSGVRRTFALATTYEQTEPLATIAVTFEVDHDRGAIAVAADLAGVPWDRVDQVAMMNEQGAHAFPRYRDSSGAELSGDAIGAWDEVAAEKATFVSRAHRVAFSAARAEGATLRRGRELVGSRLAWSGFGCSVARGAAAFRYELSVERTP